MVTVDFWEGAKEGGKIKTGQQQRERQKEKKTNKDHKEQGHHRYLIVGTFLSTLVTVVPMPFKKRLRIGARPKIPLWRPLTTLVEGSNLFVCVPPFLDF